MTGSNLSGRGKAGRGIAGITKPNATTARIAFDDGTAPVDLTLPAGPAGPAGISGLLVANSTLLKGNFYYPYAGGFNLLRPGSQELGLGVVTLVDVNGNQITTGNVVEVTGLGFVDGQSYYCEEPDGNGRNWAPLPAAGVTAAIAQSTARAFYYLGKAQTIGAKMYFDFRYEPSVADTASVRQLFSAAGLTYSATPTAAQVRRITDVGAAAPSGTSFQLYADGDAGQDATFQASPVQASVGGTTKGVYLKEVDTTQSKPHGGTPGIFSPTQAGEYLLLVQASEGSGAALGMLFASSATDLYTARFYGGALDYVAGQHYTATGTTVTAVTGSDLFAGHGITALGNHKLIWMRLRVDGKNLKFKAWNYDTSKPFTPAGIAAQGANEPAAWMVDYTHTAAFPVGEVGWLLDNAEARIHQMSKSYDPAVPAPFAVS